jgi:hypothetical protein
MTVVARTFAYTTALDLVSAELFIESVGALPTAVSGGFAGRPGPREPRIDGFYVAGDWVGPEGFLADASLASARTAAELALKDGTVEWREMAAGAAR